MARIRTVKPGFFASEDVARLTMRARLTWLGLWTYADDAGRAKANLRLIKAAVWPLDDDVTLDEIDLDLRELEVEGRIVRYAVDGTEYLEISNWDHQRINRPTPSSLPPRDSSLSDHGDVTEDSPQEGKGRERKGARSDTHGVSSQGARPSPHCARHPGGTTKPCRACGDARRAHDAWTETVPGLPTAAEALNPELCEHEFRVGACPACRRAAR